MTRPWLVPVTALRRAPGSRRQEHRVGQLEALSVNGSAVAAGTDVTVDVVLDAVIGGIEVSGTVRAPWTGECRRCLRQVAGELVSQVRELYRPDGGDPQPDDETYSLGTDHLDLAPLARDALLLELPLAPLCRDDCPGLCPTCGADLGDGPCACPPVATDPRWGPLEVLRSIGPADR